MMPGMMPATSTKTGQTTAAGSRPAVAKEPASKPKPEEKSKGDELKSGLQDDETRLFKETAEDPDVKEFLNYFDIDQRTRMRMCLNLARRPDTFESDMIKLWEVMGESKYEYNTRLIGCLREMEDGNFKTKAPKPDRELKEFIKKHDLDKIASSRINDALYHRLMKIKDPEKRENDKIRVLRNLDYEIQGARSASQLIMKYLRVIENGESIVPGKGARPMREIEAHERKR